MNTPNYWLVGSNWGGADQAETFFLRGYWESGYDDNEPLDQTKRRKLVRVGDRIALKSMDGHGATTITVKALGIVKDMDDHKIYIDWKITDLNRSVPSHGAYATIHGPYTFSEAWIHEAFCL
jgi:hypothetical protein